ncbi:MAG: flagellar hook-basal body complex protein [Planctomycetes bacterium]|nr:flagellar hook-basal body complex protein [Planctomycetota bacterium]
MDSSFAISQNGIYAGDIRQNTIANNLANLTTDGFRSVLVDQATLMEQGTRVNGLHEDLITVGAPRQTGQDTHFMIDGEGFFQVQAAGGIAYTRSGNFTVDSNGQLVNPSGYIVEPGVTVPEEALAIRVSVDGSVFAQMSDGSAPQIGQLEIARFVNPSGLTSIGDNLYLESVESGPATIGTPTSDGLGSVRQFMVEGSNVDPSTELTQLLVNQRYQQFNLRVFQTTDALVGRAMDLFS